MPQFDIFSFFSQLFWVLIAFSYLYLALSFYILPAFAATLKIRTKKLSQLDLSSDANSLSQTSASNLTFLTNLTNNLNDITFVRSDLTSSINKSYVALTLKNEIYYQFNYATLTQSKLITIFV